MTVTLRQHEEFYGPPATPVLTVDVIGGTAYLTIATWEETHETVTLTTVAQVAVSLPVLLSALDHEVTASKLEVDPGAVNRAVAAERNAAPTDTTAP